MEATTDNGEKEYQEGEAFYSRRQYKQAQEKLFISAKKGNTDAQAMLGVFYKMGDCGFKKDVMEATKWLSRTADQNADAALILGHIYADDDLPQYDLVKAELYYKKAYLLGNLEAAGYLGLLYMNGKYIKMDYSTADSYFDMAITNEIPMGYYGKGLIAEKSGDKDTAYTLYKQAGDHGYNKSAIDDALVRVMTNGSKKDPAVESAGNTIIIVAVVALIILLYFMLK